jgi:hypothetical protein
MRVFDANCAVGPWPTDKPQYETVNGLLGEMARLGIQRALVSHTLARTYDPALGNRVLMDEIAGQEALEPCWTLLPPACGEMGGPDELLAEMAQAGVRAARLYPREHSYSLAEWQCGELFGALDERRYVVLMDLAQGSWEDVERICRIYPRLALVVTKVGYRELRHLFALLRQCSNLYCDLSNLSTYLGVEEILDRFGSERLIFGTGLPTADPGGPLARLFYTDALPSALDAIAHGNLERLLDRVQRGSV